MKLTDEQIQVIARKVAESLGHGAAASADAPEERGRGDTSLTGIFRTIDGAVSAAETAFRQFAEMTLEKRAEVIASIRAAMLANAEYLAREAHRETGLGRLESKIMKNRLVTEKTPGTEALKSVAWSGDDGLTLVERAPYGVIAAITPTTNPTSTIICNTIGMLAAGNAVVFNVHPNAKMVSSRCKSSSEYTRVLPSVRDGASNPSRSYRRSVCGCTLYFVATALIM